MRRLLLPLLISASLPAMAQTFPERNGAGVVDAANVIPADQEAALNEQIVTWVKKTGHQLVVVTVPSLQGYPIEEYGYKLGRAWGLGDKERNDGVLLINAPNERKLRIEVGYGLEPILTDARTGQILREDVVPGMKENNIPKALTVGAMSIMSVVNEADREEAAAKTRPQTVVNVDRSDSGAGWWIAGILGLLGIGGTSWAVFLGRRRARYAREMEERFEARRREREAQKPKPAPRPSPEERLAKEVREMREAPQPEPRRRTGMRPEMGMPYGTTTGRSDSGGLKRGQPPKRERYEEAPVIVPVPTYTPPPPPPPPPPSYTWDPPSPPPPPSPSFDSGGGSFGGGGSSTEY